ncbi:MAG: hypothetical protein GF308_11670 [Candidatus Heimdallarchaeota archaeon]|nr:hypothetical protein [Candidatus Heimdallarchaeota archaeon]
MSKLDIEKEEKYEIYCGGCGAVIGKSHIQSAPGSYDLCEKCKTCNQCRPGVWLPDEYAPGYPYYPVPRKLLKDYYSYLVADLENCSSNEGQEELKQKLQQVKKILEG